MRPDMHDRCDSISLLRYVPPERLRTSFLFLFLLLPLFLVGHTKRSRRGVSCRVSSCRRFPVVALENYVKASHTLMFGTFGLH